jgi:uncharacterized protein YgfB (UPF0149 family)
VIGSTFVLNYFLNIGRIIMSELYFPSLSPSNDEGEGPESTAELQGALCGLLCLNAEASRTAWYKNLYEDFNPDEDEALDLAALFDDTIQALNSLDFDLQLELPEDDAPIASRVLAMVNWCHGLIFGLGTSGLTDETELSDDCKEYISDVISISQIDIDETDDSDTDTNFEELVEYLRMGLFLLYGELQPVNTDQNQTEH